MNTLKPFEIEVIRRLTKDVLAPRVCDQVIAEAKVVDIDFTGAGYYLTSRHSALPSERYVCSVPALAGRGGGADTGFLVFLGDRELVLECHLWGEAEQFPADYRDHEIQLFEPFA